MDLVQFFIHTGVTILIVMIALVGINSIWKIILKLVDLNERIEGGEFRKEDGSSETIERLRKYFMRRLILVIVFAAGVGLWIAVQQHFAVRDDYVNPVLEERLQKLEEVEVPEPNEAAEVRAAQREQDRLGLGCGETPCQCRGPERISGT
jgi:hypothetical protein